ncbi:MAG: hypothetical protein IJK04_12940, partial [Kiritimatiellae bacterium]|nr:hypothetical protein [Kiritimatiellia bacterium]
MSRLTLPVFASFLSAFSAAAQNGLYETVTNLWWDGSKSNVIAIADARLAIDSNDIVGVTLRLECDFSFGRPEAFSNSVCRFSRVGSGIRTPSFRVLFPFDAFDGVMSMFAVSDLTAAEWEAECAKGLSAAHRPLPMPGLWEALNADGWLGASLPSNVLDEAAIDRLVPARASDLIPHGKMLVAFTCLDASVSSGLHESHEAAMAELRHGSDPSLLAMSEQRLQDDPNDLFGATAALFYHFRRCDPSVLSNAVDRIAVLSNAVERVRTIGASETRSPFADHWPWISVFLDNVRIWLSGTNAVP